MLTIVMCSTTVLLAQVDCDLYPLIIKKVEKAVTEKKFREALNQLKAARACDPTKQKAIDYWYDVVFNGIDQQREQAVLAQEDAKDRAQEAEKLNLKAKEEQENTKRALKHAEHLKLLALKAQASADSSNQVAQQQARLLEREKVRTENALGLAETMINSLYFYRDSFAVARNEDAYGEDVYGFINKKGEILIEHKYEEAQPFGEIGYARVMRNGKTFFLNTKGEEFEFVNNLKELTNKVSLDYSNRRVSRLPNQIFKDTAIKILLLSNNKISKLPPKIELLSEIATVDLSDNRIQLIPPAIGRCQKLNHLNLSNNQITRIPQELGMLKKLQYLNLNGNKLDTLPEEINKLTYLQSLYLSFNQLKAIPAEIGHLFNLKSLFLSDNAISALPSEIGKLGNLRTLYLHYNKLDSLPPSMGSLSNLRHLYLSYNNLDSLPAEMSSLKHLKILSLVRNNFTIMPNTIYELPTLESLDLSINQIESFSGQIARLSSLQTLRLAGNKINSLPSEIGKLENLKSLDLSLNQIDSLPVNIGKLHNLQTLNLASNQLNTLPDEIENLINLTSLDLSGNQLRVLPHGLKKLKKLVSLNLANNPLELEELKHVPEEFYAQNLLPNAYFWYDSTEYFKAFQYCQEIAKQASLSNHFKQISIVCSNLAWKFLQSNAYKNSLDAVLLAEELDAMNTNVYINLPLIFLFNDQFEKAKEIVLKYKNQSYDGQLIRTLYEKDVTILEEMGFMHKNLAKYKELLAK